MSSWDLNLHGHFDIYFPWCKSRSSRDEFNNQSTLLHGLQTSSTTNQHSYMALGWLHCPWCKQPLMVPHILSFLVPNSWLQAWPYDTLQTITCPFSLMCKQLDPLCGICPCWEYLHWWVLEAQKGLDTLQQGCNWNSFHCTHCNETRLHAQMHWQLVGECDKPSIGLDNIYTGPQDLCINEQIMWKEREGERKSWRK